MVIELPIRDGNLERETTSTVATYVIELPIRDGNLRNKLFSSLLWLVIELPIRDGNRQECQRAKEIPACY